MSTSNDAHARPAAPPPSFSEPDVAAPSHAERARTLVSNQKTGSLATLASEPAGYPYASFVTFALMDGEPLFLISRLAEHTRNLVGDARASLLAHETGSADPLANGRVTLVGRANKLPRGDTLARDTYLAVHPTASYYVDFEDFDFFRLSLESVRYIGGYGRMSWVTAEDFRRATPDPIADAAPRILEHMNQDHAEALRLYARAFTRAVDAEQAVMTAIDRHGFEMTITTPGGPGPARIAFDQPLVDANDARLKLIALLRIAETKLHKK
jgi:heme oxygenase (biliverdin-IX-beta and delta-forming)